MEFFTTKIVDQPVESKINLEKINELLSSSELPKDLTEIDKVIVTIVAREPNDFSFEAWRKNGKVYLIIPLVYEEIMKGTEEEITEKCSKLFGTFISNLKFEA